MAKGLKQGERVAVYGFIDEQGTGERMECRVETNPNSSRVLRVRKLFSQETFTVHETQCVRVKKAKPLREFWVLAVNGIPRAYDSLQLQADGLPYPHQIHVRETRKPRQ
jgi:hypothetical protein